MGHWFFKVADLSPKNIFGNKPPQMVPTEPNIDSGPNLQPCIFLSHWSFGAALVGGTKIQWKLVIVVGVFSEKNVGPKISTFENITK